MLGTATSTPPASTPVRPWVPTEQQRLRGWFYLLSALDGTTPSTSQMWDTDASTRPNATQLGRTVVVYLVVAAISLYAAWQTGTGMMWSLHFFVVSLPLIVGLTFTLVLIFTPLAPLMPPAAVLPGLRQPTLVGDPLWAPPVYLYPSPMPIAPGSTAELRVAPSARLNASPAGIQWRGVLSTLLTLPSMAIALIGLTLDTALAGSLWQSFLFLLVYLAIPASAFTLLPRLRRLRRPYQCVADAQALTVRQGNTTRVIPWSEVRGLWRIWVPRRSISLFQHWLHPLYVLDTGETPFTWTSPRSRPAENDPAWQLCLAVVAQTQRPLLDLTPAAEALAAQLVLPNPRLSWRNPVARLDARAATSPQLRRLLVADVLAIVLGLATIGALLGQGSAYAAWLARAEGNTPLLADALHTETGALPRRNGPAESYRYDGTAFVLTNTNYDAAAAWTTATYTDATVEVTLHLNGGFDLGNAGLILRTNDADQSAMVFTIDRSGDWKLERQSLNLEHEVYQQFVDQLFVGAIHKEPGAANRLAVIMRGGTYTFFINGQFVGVYRDTTMPTSGHIGLYMASVAENATFSDLAVYSAPPPPWGLDLWLPNYPLFPLMSE